MGRKQKTRVGERKIATGSGRPTKTAARKKNALAKAISKRDSRTDSRQIETQGLTELHLDPENPRFGILAGSMVNEIKMLDYIVEQLGIEDVLSSIAVNGYFPSEPLLVKRIGGKLIVAEGNRRLAACLILAGDPRAKNQTQRTENYREIHEAYGEKPFDPLPVAIFETAADMKVLFPYLGVRHIAGAMEWDSYAKATWVAQAVDEHGMELDDVINMIGDNTRLAVRMLHGYYIVQQLVNDGYFEPTATTKKGTKSNPDFPFSWVYTAIGYRSVGDWLSLPSRPQPEPLNTEGEKNACELFTWMFGQHEEKPAIDESRGIKELARAVEDPERLSLLRAGHSIAEIEVKTRPSGRRVIDGLTQAHDQLAEVYSILGDGSLEVEAAEACLPLGRKTRNLANRVHRELERTAELAEDDDV